MTVVELRQEAEVAAIKGRVRVKPVQVLVKRILGEVWRHPANRRQRLRAIGRAIGWQVKKRSGRGPVSLSAYGLALTLPRASGSLSNYFYFGEQFEWQTIGFLRAFARPGDVIVDGGANIGMFSYAAWQCVAPTGRVESFEPIGALAETIRNNVAANGLEGRVVVHQAAVSDTVGVVRFTADLDVSNHIVDGAGTVAGRSYVEVPTMRIDDVVEGPVTIIKLDVEGAEFHALLGCQGLIESQPPAAVVVIEAHDHSLRELGSSRAAVLQLLDSWGYRPVELRQNPQGLRVLDWAQLSHADIICVHRTAMDVVEQRLRDVNTSFLT